MSRRQAPGLASPRSAAIVPFQATNRDHPEDGPVASPPRANALKLVAGYARVSSDKQEKEQTIDSQVDALRRVAEERGWHLLPDLICIDDGRSGATLARPGLDRLRDLITEGTCSAVLICSPDRLARNYAYQVLVIDEFKRSGCEAVFLNHAFGDSPEQQMLLQMQGVFAEYERALITERTRRGRLFWARQGRVNWGGTPTYGYRLFRGTETGPQQLAVAEHEATVVRQMYRWLIDEQLSSYAIQKRLIERTIPTRKESGRGWSQSTVIRILSSTTYKGEAWYNRRCLADRSHTHLAAGLTSPGLRSRSRQALRPTEEWIPVPVPAIIDPDTWRLAQEQLAQNRQRARRNNTRHAYLLSALLICSHCGRRMIGAADGLDQRRYVCSARYPRHARGACDGHSITAAHVEAQVWRWTAQLLSEPTLLRARFEESRGDLSADSAGQHEGARIERQLRGLDREIERLIDAYQAAAITLAELQKRRRGIEDHGRHLRARLDEIQQQRSAREQELRLLQGLQAFCDGIRDALIEPSFETKQKVLRLVVDRVVVENDRLVIQHVVPITPIGLQPHLRQATELRRRSASVASWRRAPTKPISE
jgi:site-specific DNA recombinase